MLKKAIRLIKDNAFMAPVLFLVDMLFFCVDLLAAMGSRKTAPGKICIIKLDKLGDYILVRNFLLYIKRSNLYKDHKLTIIANIENKKFVEYLDGNAFDNIIWVNIYQYASNISYRFKIARHIYREGFDTAIVPTYARVLVLDDFLSFATRAKTRIGQTPHLINIKKWEVRIGNPLYTNLINVNDGILFEFERNRQFFEKLLQEDLSGILLNLDAPANREALAHPYVVIMPGAADAFRQWSPQDFSQVADFIIAERNASVVLCGSPSERAIGEEIIKMSSHPAKIRNDIGTLGMDELFKTYSGALFIVTNETGGVHINAAMNKIVFCISNGNHFMKYSEYPAKLNKQVHYVYPQEVDNLMSDPDKIARKFDFRSNLDINTIQVSKVLNQIQNHKQN